MNNTYDPGMVIRQSWPYQSYPKELSSYANDRAQWAPEEMKLMKFTIGLIPVPGGSLTQVIRMWQPTYEIRTS